MLKVQTTDKSDQIKYMEDVNEYSLNCDGENENSDIIVNSMLLVQDLCSIFDTNKNINADGIELKICMVYDTIKFDLLDENSPCLIHGQAINSLRDVDSLKVEKLDDYCVFTTDKYLSLLHEHSNKIRMKFFVEKLESLHIIRFPIAENKVIVANENNILDNLMISKNSVYASNVVNMQANELTESLKSRLPLPIYLKQSETIHSITEYTNSIVLDMSIRIDDVEMQSSMRLNILNKVYNIIKEGIISNDGYMYRMNFHHNILSFNIIWGITNCCYYNNASLAYRLCTLTKKQLSSYCNKYIMTAAISSGAIFAGTLGSNNRKEYVCFGKPITDSSYLNSITSKDFLIIDEATMNKLEWFEKKHFTLNAVNIISSSYKFVTIDSLSNEYFDQTKFPFNNFIMSNITRALDNITGLKNPKIMTSKLPCNSVKKETLKEETSISSSNNAIYEVNVSDQGLGVFFSVLYGDYDIANVRL